MLYKETRVSSSYICHTYYDCSPILSTLTVNCQSDCWLIVTYWVWVVEDQLFVPGKILIPFHLVNLLSIQKLLFLENSPLFFANRALIWDTVNLSDLLFCLAAVGETASVRKMKASLGDQQYGNKKKGRRQRLRGKTQTLYAFLWLTSFCCTRCGCTYFACSQRSCKQARLKIDSLPWRRKLHSNEFALSHTLGQF